MSEIAWSAINPETGAFVSIRCADDVEAVLSCGAGAYASSGKEGVYYRAAFTSVREERIRCFMRLGVSLSVPGLWAHNSVEVQLPNLAILRSSEPVVFLEMLRAAAMGFNPRWACVVTMENGVSYPRGESPELGAPTVGWMTYLSGELGDPGSLPTPSRGVSLDGMGTIVIARPQPWNPADAEQRASLDAMRMHLRALGLMRAAVDARGGGA